MLTLYHQGIVGIEINMHRGRGTNVLYLRKMMMPDILYVLLVGASVFIGEPMKVPDETPMTIEDCYNRVALLTKYEPNKVYVCYSEQEYKKWKSTHILSTPIPMD